MSVILQPHVEERLRANEMIWLTTVRPDGRPHAVAVWFLWEDTKIFIFSKPNTQKIRNIMKNNYSTLMLDDTKNGSDIVIMEGMVELLKREDVGSIVQVYGQKYREGLQRIGVSAESFTMFYSQPIQVMPVRLITGK